MSAVTEAPTTELGTAFDFGGIKLPGALGVGPKSAANPFWELLDTREYTPDLKWPHSREVYEQMRNDSQINGLWMGLTLPIRRYKWMIDPNGAREEIVTALAEDLNLPIKGEDPKPVGRRQKRFDHDSHLHHALLALVYGFMFFEQVGEVLDDNGRLLWRLRKLGPRMPHSIFTILADRDDGGLAGIRQNGVIDPIPVDRLAGYIWQREGANWFGRSMLRPLYPNWLIKNKLLRVDAIKHERNGMGVPTAIATTADPTSRQMKEAQRIAQKWRAGETASAALPFGTDIELKGVKGNLPDTLASIKYHDEAMARSFLMMFMMLGQTQSGSRSLGDSFIDFFDLSQETVGIWYRDNTNLFVVEDWMNWNWGADEGMPMLDFERVHDKSFPLADLIALISAGAITMDQELEDYLRAEGGLPEFDPATARPKPTDPPVTVKPPIQDSPMATSSKKRIETRANGARVIRSSAGAVILPDRPLHREPTDVEMTAQVNFKKLDDSWKSAVDAMVAHWQSLRLAQINELHTKIAATTDLTKLAEIMATVPDVETLVDHLKSVMKDGIDTVVAEAAAQGVNIASPDLEAVAASEQARATALATAMTRALSQAAGQRAVQISGGSMTQQEVADNVRSYLEGMSDAYLRDQIGGITSQAQLAGRRSAFDTGQPSRLYASELLDANTCQACAQEDGTEFASLDDASRDYPGGGFVDCAGGPRCRGTLIGVWDEGAKVEAVV